MKLRKPLVIVSLALVVALLAASGVACTPKEQRIQEEGEAVIWQYIEAAFYQDADSVRDCLHSIALQEFDENDWTMPLVLEQLYTDIDEIELEFAPYEERSFEDIPLITIKCRTPFEGGDLELEFWLAEEEGELKVLGWQQAAFPE